MKATGLVIAGGLDHSFVTRMPALVRALGPVKGASLRVARRIVNTLRAGFAVADYAALEPCSLIWIAVPESMLDQVAQDLAARTPLEGKMIVLCGSTRESTWPGPLRAVRASVASLNVIDGTLVAEGDARTIRELGRLAAAERLKLIELQPGSKPLFFVGIHLATHLLLPWIAAAVESLRAAGFSRAEATLAVENMGARSLRAYAKAGRKAWSPAAAPELHRALENSRSLDPELAAMYAEGIRQALRYFEKNPGHQAANPGGV